MPPRCRPSDRDWRDNKRRWHHDGRGWASADRRPPWWPKSEAWPPQDEAGWRELRRGFMRRAGCFVLLALVLLTVIVSIVISVIANVTGAQPIGVVAALFIVVGFVLVVRWIVAGFRSSAAPVGELIEAAGRVEAGELGVQVPERGVREVRALTRSFNAMSGRLESTERERKRLLAEVSHELRTPLTVIQGNVEAMIDGVYPADREHLERIRAETRQLERLIDDLRTLSLAETGQLSLVREPTDLGALAREVVDGFQAEASAANVTLAVEAAEDQLESELDPFRMRQVIANLVSNALRHTPADGRVTVSVRRSNGALELSVADTGAGMSADGVEHAFERFWKSGDSAGAGLGLAIVRDLIAAHGGTIELQSEKGKGTVVTCRIPA